MAHTNQTPNYELSQFLGTDKPAWLVDYNGDMEKIDLGMKAAKDVADAAKAEADQGALDIAAVTVTANSADAKASGAVSDLADAYDSTSTYNVGDYVIYNSILYRCITAIIVPESFDGTHWVRTTVEEITAALSSDIAQINSDLMHSKVVVYVAQTTYPIDTIITLGTLSEVTNGAVTSASDVKGISLIHAFGQYDYDFGRLVLNTGNNTMYYKCATSQPSLTVKYSILY